MEIRDLMAGIAVVIDDKLDSKSGEDEDAGNYDNIDKIVDWFENEWELPFMKLKALPPRALWSNTLATASFVLLDWKLWGDGGETLRRSTIKDIISFLKVAKANLVPVFIFTMEDPVDVIDELPDDVYDEDTSGRNYVFIKRKTELWSEDGVDLTNLEEWVSRSASVYALKTWNLQLNLSKNELFLRMRELSVDWPRVFWSSYVKDGADPSSSLMSLINDCLLGRMRLNAFEAEYLSSNGDEVSTEQLRQLIAEASFRDARLLPADEIRCGDLFKGTKRKYLLNLRPDCDCVPRSGKEIGAVEVHCVEGKKLRQSELKELYNEGHFNERVFQCVVFAVLDGNSIIFDFKKLKIVEYSQLKDNRLGRLLHPFVTRVQQRFTAYMQRQGLPRIPEKSIEKS